MGAATLTEWSCFHPIYSCRVDTVTGNISEEKVKENLSLAISKQEVREKLNIFLKGFNKKKDELRENKPDLFKHFSDIWKIRNSHMIRDLPSNYVFFLVCCYQPDCLHPLQFQ